MDVAADVLDLEGRRGLRAEHDLREAAADGVEELARRQRGADHPQQVSPAASTPIPPVCSLGTYGVRSTFAFGTW